MSIDRLATRLGYYFFILVFFVSFSANAQDDKMSKNKNLSPVDSKTKKINSRKKNKEIIPDLQLPFTYNPSSWMGDFLLSNKSDYTLKDIVIPGSHDAGMSVLTAAGGQQKGTINECNTLTQVLNIEGQLESGIRMFDLRIGIYNGEMYTKHCASDCMEDAIELNLR